MSGSPWLLVAPGAVRPDPAIPRERWPLTESARRDVVLLAHALPRPLAARIAAGSALALQQTAALLQLRVGGFVRHDARLDPPGRPPVWLETYEAMRARWLRGDPLPGWEAREEVVARVLAAGEAASRRPHGGIPIVVTAHLAVAATVAVLTGAVPEAGDVPRPAAFLVDAEGKRVARVFPTIPRFERPLTR